MVATLDDTKRRAIATALADPKALQELLIATEQTLMPSVSSGKEMGDCHGECSQPLGPVLVELAG